MGTVCDLVKLSLHSALWCCCGAPRGAQSSVRVGASPLTLTHRHWLDSPLACSSRRSLFAGVPLSLSASLSLSLSRSLTHFYFSEGVHLHRPFVVTPGPYT